MLETTEPVTVSDIATAFEAQVARTPEKVALCFGPRVMTYRELDSRANALAARLLEAGAAAEVPVALFVERSFDMVVAEMAVFKAGAICLPLETSCPRERLCAMLADAEARLLITQPGLEPPPGARVLHVTDERQMEVPARTVSLEAGAQIMFTSGSSGRPKGVTLTQAGLMNFLLAMRGQPGMRQDDSILALANYTFDPVMVEVYLPLLVGATVILLTRDVASDGLRLLDTVMQRRPTILNATPATYRMLLDAGWPIDNDYRPLIICGGETLTTQMAADLLPRCRSLWNVYGPTEATALCALHRVTLIEESIPIGRPLPNTELLILDESGQPVGPGVVGELHIGGICLSRGYLNRSELNDQKFIAHPFDKTPGARLYRSGDRARWRPDGTIELLGRQDGQLKIHGFRIEPGDIESTLLQHPQVGDAVVLAHASGLVAYVIPRLGGALPTTDSLREFSERMLPAYMQPSAFVPLAAWPLSPNVKVDRQALLAWPLPLTREPRPGAEVEVLGALEETLSRLFGDVLKTNVRATDNFSQLGLNSLTAVRLLRRIETELSRRVPHGVLLQARTIRQLASLLENNHLINL